MKTPFSEQNIHRAFETTLVFKGLHAAVELIGGLVLLFVSEESIRRLIVGVAQGELSEDPRDFIATALIRTAGHLTISGQHFAALYLFSHGVLNGFLVLSLFRQKTWAYPLTIAVIGFFIAYQLYRYTLTPSLWLLALTLFDGLIIWLTWREYRIRKSKVVIPLA
ncbi:MAG: DUF2127 domain-containing protein [Undibacterium sp.]